MEAEGAEPAEVKEYLAKVEDDRNMPLSRRQKLSEQYTHEPVFFSWDIPRTREGYYHYKAGLPAATKRAIAFAPYADLLWLETAEPSVDKAADFAAKIHAEHKLKPLVYNLSPSFNWMAHGFNETTLKSFIWDLARHG